MTDSVLLLDQKIEDRFLRAVMEYPKLVQLTAELLSRENFSSRIKSDLYTALLFYWKEFNEVPTEDILNVVLEELYPAEKGKLVQKLVKRLFLIPAPEWSWIVSKLDEHIKTIQLHKSLFEASELLKKGSIVDAEFKIVDTIKNSGLLTSESKNDLELTKSDIFNIAYEEDSFCCPTRIYALDDVIRGLFRKELFLVMAPLNVGKSWAAVHMAYSALLSGKHVLYLTLEMSKDRVLQRILQSVSGTYSPRFPDDLTKITQIWDSTWTEKEEYTARSLLNSSGVHRSLGILKRFGGVLSVKEYPAGTASVGDIEKEVILYDVVFGKLPDVIIVDGLLDIKYSGSTDSSRQRLGLTQVTRELRRFASEYNAAVLTTHQANREAIGVEVVGAQHTGESLGIVQVADTGISLNQTKSEYQTGKMRINVMRSRNRQKWGTIEIWQNLDIGQFHQASRKGADASEEDEKPTRRRVRGNRNDSD